jgi:hypothetical protein
MWHDAMAATNASSGSTPAGSDSGGGTTNGRRGGGNVGAAIEYPAMRPAEAIVGEGGAVALPFELGGVLAHVSRLLRTGRLRPPSEAQKSSPPMPAMARPPASLSPTTVRDNQIESRPATLSASRREVTARTAITDTVNAVPTAMARVEAMPAQ